MFTSKKNVVSVLTVLAKTMIRKLLNELKPGTVRKKREINTAGLISVMTVPQKKNEQKLFHMPAIENHNVLL